MTPGPDMENDPQLTALYRAGTDADPPGHLDDAIRAAARREVAAGPRRHGLRRWSVPVSLAAVVVLSVTVVTMMRERGADRPETLALPPPAESPAAAKRDAAPPPVAVPETQVPRRVAPRPAVPLTATPAPAPGQAAEAEKPGQGAMASGSESRAKAAAAAAEDRGARREQAASQPLLRSAPAPMTDDATAGAGASPRTPLPGAAAPAARQSALWQDLVEAPPELWIRRIAELRRTGKTADAEALVAEFRRRFPAERLPDEGR
jgi:hypothetical protein